jgi:hypothetical protein
MAKHYDAIAKLFESVYSGWYTQHGLKDFFGPFYDWSDRQTGREGQQAAGCRLLRHAC